MGNVVLYWQPVPRAQFVALVLDLFAWSALCSVLLYPPPDTFFVESALSWLPDSFFFAKDLSGYPTAALPLTWALGLIISGVVGPVVEELYFRGYLLPRISCLGA